MKKLESYKRNKLHFSLVERFGKYGIFHGQKPDGRSRTYEVIEIQSHNGLTIGGVYMPPAEFCPNDNQWGAKGWTYTALSDARKKLSELIK